MYEGKYRIGIIGDGAFLNTAIDSWLASGRVGSLAICDKSGYKPEQHINGFDYYDDEFEMLAVTGLDALEFASSDGIERSVFESSIKIGLPLAVSGTLAENYAATLNMTAAIGAMRTPFMYMNALNEHPFIDRAVKEMKRESIGELQMLRVKSNAGHLTDRRHAEDNGNPLLRREFDRTSLIEKLFGPVTEVFCLAGQNAWLVSYRFVAPGRYGFLEAVLSPDLRFNSDGPSIDDSIEITGTDGIIWLRNLNGLLTEAPRFAMKRRDETLILDDRIEYSLESRELDLRLRFIESIEKKGAAPFDAAPVLRAARLAEAARLSVLESRPVRPDEISPYQK